MVSLRRHFVPNPVPFSETRFTPPCKLFLVLHTRYDNLNRRTQVTGPDPDGPGGQSAAVTTYVYDDAGHMTSMTDALGGVTAYQYLCPCQLAGADFRPSPAPE